MTRALSTLLRASPDDICVGLAVAFLLTLMVML